jgi:hypothetical protein
MNTYTIEELKDLAIAIDRADIFGGSTDTPEAALNNVFNIITDYCGKGLDAIHDKMLEFADIGKALPYENYEANPYLMIYQLIYEISINEMPMYINSPYELIANWRLCLTQKVV